MTVPRLLSGTACAIACAAGLALLPGCALWTGDAPAPRTSVLLSGARSLERPPRLQRLVAAMDAEAFPHRDGLQLKLSYRLSPAGPQLARKGAPAAAAG